MNRYINNKLMLLCFQFIVFRHYLLTFDYKMMVYLAAFGHSLPIIVSFFIVIGLLLITFTIQNAASSKLRCPLF